MLAENGTIQGSITGVPASSMANKLWLAFQALGDIAFAYPYSLILLEIQVVCLVLNLKNKNLEGYLRT